MLMMFFILHLLAFLVGVLIVIGALRSAIQIFVVPRSISDKLAHVVFLTMRRIFDLRSSLARSYLGRDTIMAFYAPVSLLSLPAVWLCLVMVGYTGMFWAVGVSSWRAAFLASGSSLLTLGFAPLALLPETILGFSEAAIGLFLVALLISYLPTIYAAWSRREAAVTMLEVRAGSPPSAVEMIERFHRLHRAQTLDDLWPVWEAWFTDVDESHTSLAALPFFRSPSPSRSWITAAGAVLDAAALHTAVLDAHHDAEADLCIRAGYLALRHIADFFKISYNPAPQPDDPISITRAEFDAACAHLANAGVPLKADRNQSWRDFAGWRVNYDTVLLALCRLVMAPPAPWSTDLLQKGYVESKPLPIPAAS